MISSIQKANTEISAFIAVLIFKLLRHKSLIINRKDNRNCLKVVYFLRKWQISRLNYYKKINSWNAKFSGHLKHVSDHLLKRGSNTGIFL